jgi:hypothetical protein
MGSRAHLDAIENIRITCTYLESNPSASSPYLVATPNELPRNNFIFISVKMKTKVMSPLHPGLLFNYAAVQCSLGLFAVPDLLSQWLRQKKPQQ